MSIDLKQLGTKLKKYCHQFEQTLDEVFSATGIEDTVLAAYESGNMKPSDTCAVWNILSSEVLYGKARALNCEFCITSYVHYECLYKPRREISDGFLKY